MHETSYKLNHRTPPSRLQKTDSNFKNGANPTLAQSTKQMQIDDKLGPYKNALPPIKVNEFSNTIYNRKNGDLMSNS